MKIFYPMKWFLLIIFLLSCESPNQSSDKNSDDDTPIIIDENTDWIPIIQILVADKNTNNTISNAQIRYKHQKSTTGMVDIYTNSDGIARLKAKYNTNENDTFWFNVWFVKATGYKSRGYMTNEDFTYTITKTMNEKLFTILLEKE